MAWVDLRSRVQKTPRELYKEQIYAALLHGRQPELVAAQSSVVEGSTRAKEMIASYRNVVDRFALAGIEQPAETLHGIYKNCAQQLPVTPQQHLDVFNQLVDRWLDSNKVPHETISPEDRKNIRDYIDFQNTLMRYQRVHIEWQAKMTPPDNVAFSGSVLQEAIAKLFGGNMTIAKERTHEFTQKLDSIGVRDVCEPIAKTLTNEWLAEHHWDVKQLLASPRLRLSDDARDSEVVKTFVHEVVQDAITGGEMHHYGKLDTLLHGKAAPGSGPLYEAGVAVEALLGKKAARIAMEEGIRSAVLENGMGFGAHAGH